MKVEINRKGQTVYTEIGDVLLELYEPAEALRKASKALADVNPALSRELNAEADKAVARVKHLGELLKQVNA